MPRRTYGIEKTRSNRAALALLTKDVGIAAALAHGLGQTAVLADTVHAQLAAALDALGPAVDHSAAITYWSGGADDDVG